MDDQVFKLLVDKIDSVEKKVDTLMSFRWQVSGGIIVFNIIFGLIIQLGLTYLRSK